MSDALDLRVSESLELLKRLTRTVADFVAKEDQLTRDLRSRRFTMDRQYREALSKSEGRLNAQIADTDLSFNNEQGRITSIYESRRTRIQRARTAGIRNLPRRALEAKGKWMGDLQRRHFHAERARTSGLQAVDTVFADFAEKLTTERVTLLKLERRARKFFGEYSPFLRLLQAQVSSPARPDQEPKNQDELLDEFRAQLGSLTAQIAAFRQFVVPRLFSYAPLPAVLLLIVLAGLVVAFMLGSGRTWYATVGAGLVVLLGAVWLSHRLGLRKAEPNAVAIATTLAAARSLHDAASASSEAKRERDRKRLNDQFEHTCDHIREQWDRADDVETEFHRDARKKIETQEPRALAKIEELMGAKLQRIASDRVARAERFRHEAEARQRQLSEGHQAEVAGFKADEKARWEEIEREWKREIIPLYEAIEARNATLHPNFPPWNAAFAEAWTPATRFHTATKFAELRLDLTKTPASVPRAAALALPGSAQVSIPLALTFPRQGSLLFETNESGGAAVVGVLNNVILRLLSTTPPGKLSFTIIDPVGLGENFAGLMHLSDYEESLINRRIWTQRDQIEERLAELSEHIEKVIQMYLRNEYATITEYNEQAGSVAEKYHFLVVADFPANFSETAAKRLQSIATSGPRCGIYTLIHWDERQALPDGFVPDELRKNSVCIARQRREFVLNKEQAEMGAALLFDDPPEPDIALSLIHKIGKSSVDSNRVEVPFSQVAPKPAEMWTNETTNELRVAIGRTGATKLQYLAIGKGTRQHALFAGKTGSGKSTLFHVIITNLALACSPEQVEFYLVDFKKGVEFKCYAVKHLPHARVVAIESDREFALSVLQRVDAELKRRGDLFRKLGVQDVAGYKKAGGTESIPRSLLIIDEFQEFFVEDDAIAQTASLLFDRIVRQGRAFGIHVLLGSQTLGGAYSLARATLGQMVIRVALQCNEADAYLIMDDNNSAPRLLSRPGEGIYNDAAGAVEGNSPFQVVWLPDDERDVWLDTVRGLADQHADHHANPIVFEGNSPAEIRENEILQTVLNSRPTVPPAVARAWLGAPNSIKGPTEAAFQRQSGNNLLIVGQREESALTLLSVSLIALAAQYPAGTAKFILLHATTPGSRDAEIIERTIAGIPSGVTESRGQDITEIVDAIATKLKTRSGGEEQMKDAPSIFLFVHGLQKFKKLRQEDDFSFSAGDSETATVKTGTQFNDLICEGSSHGIHIIATVDTFNNVNRFINRKALSEFEMRVLFQMSANDSASLIDSPKASTLGLHRALFYNEHEGYLETFRPYAAPDPEWLGEAAEKLSRQGGHVDRFPS